MTLQEMREKRNEYAAKVKELGDLEAQGEELTDEQIKAFDEATDEYNKLDEKIASAEKRQAAAAKVKEHQDEPRPAVGAQAIAAANSPGAVPTGIRGPEAKTEFETDEQAWEAYAKHVDSKGRETDQRLLSMEGRTESGMVGFALPGLRADQTMGTGSEGGHNVPKQFRDELVRFPSSPGIMRQRAFVVPAGSPPDAEIDLPALDQSSDIHGGVSMTWYGEGDSQTETSASFRPVSLKPHEVGGYVNVTNKLMRNWRAAAAVIPGLLRASLASEEDYQFIRGDGVKKPLGFIGHASEIAVSRDTGNSIKYEDLVAMEARLPAGAMPVWLTSSRNCEQLRLLQSPEGHLIWGNGDANSGQPNTLLGYPILKAPRFPSVGTKGDLCLVDARYYAIKDGSGPFVASSEHVEFKSNKTVIKIVGNVDGQPLLNAAITDEDGNTYSPFVTIAA